MLGSRRIIAVSSLIFLLLPSLGLADSAASRQHGLRMKMSPASPSPSLSWWGTAGETYFIQVAPDLGFGWQYIDAIYSGADAALSHEFTGLGETAFFRLRSSDQPTSDPWADNFDGDYLSNADEIRLFGTDPLRYDSSGDGLGDGYAMPGWVRTEVWEDIPDKQVTALTSDPRFPHAPDSTFWLQKLESPRNWADTYGTRTRGYILPTGPATTAST